MRCPIVGTAGTARPDLHPPAALAQGRGPAAFAQGSEFVGDPLPPDGLREADRLGPPVAGSVVAAAAGRRRRRRRRGDEPTGNRARWRALQNFGGTPPAKDRFPVCIKASGGCPPVPPHPRGNAGIFARAPPRICFQ